MIHVEETGATEAPLVVLIHGSMDRATGFAKIAHRLEHEFRIVRYDRRGYARSCSLGPPYSVPQNVADLVDLLGGRRAVAIVGHSYGGNVALAFAQHHADRVGAVGVFEAPMPWEPWWPTNSGGGSAVAVGEREGTEAAAEQFMRSIVGDDVWERLPPTTRAQRRAEGAALVGELGGLRREAAYDATLIDVPVVLARGEMCRDHHRIGTTVLAERLPHASTLVLGGAGHNAHTTHPDAFADFVRGVVSRSAAG
jgi:pimeloyl-ACP methyl ester carboxylesterase